MKARDHWRLLTLFFFLALLPFMGWAQINFSRYFDDNSFSLLDLTDHQPVTFTWSIKGKLQVLMNEGINEYEEGNISRAIFNLDELIKLDSGFWPAFYYRGLCKKGSKDIAGAEKDFLKAIRLNKKVPAVYLELGEIYQFKWQYPKAKTNFETAKDLAPGTVQPYYLLANLAYSWGETGKALRYYEKCNELDPTFAPAYLYRGIMKYRANRKDINANLEFFNMAIRSDSTFKPAYFWRGLVLLASGANERVLADWSQLVRLMPNNFFILQMRGFLLIDLGRFDEAFVDLRKAVTSQDLDENKYMSGQTILNKRLDLQRAALYLIRKGYGLREETFSSLKKAFCLILAEQDTLALGSLQQAGRYEPNAPTYLLKALVFEKLRSYDSALSNYNRALALDNDIYDAHLKRALYRFDLNDGKGVYQDFLEMKRIEPESNATFRLGGLVKAGLNDYYGCIVDLTRFIKKDTTDAYVWKTRAHCRSEVNDYLGAIEDYNKCISMEPDNIRYYVSIFENNFKVPDTLAALQTAKRILARWPGDQTVRLAVANIFMELKAYDSATYMIQRVLKDLVPDSYQYYSDKSNAYFLLGQILVRRNQLENALSTLDASIKLDKNGEKLFYRAKLYLKMGMSKQAIKDLKELQKNNYEPAAEFYKQYLTK